MSNEDKQRRTNVAARVRYWTARRGLTREVFAGRIGKSLSWVDKVRAGDRALDRLSVLRTIATVLDVPLHALIDEPNSELSATCADEVQVAALENALQNYVHMYPGSNARPTPPMALLRKQVEYAWVVFQSSNLSFAGSVLPKLIGDLHACAQASDPLVIELLVHIYQVTAETAFKLGRTDLGWIAADRALHFGELSEDLALIGGASRRVIHAMMSKPSSCERALVLAKVMETRLAPHVGNGGPDVLSAYGSLLLKASIAAARGGDAARAMEFNSEAGRIAARLGGDRNIHWSAFGPTNVGIHRASAHVDLGDGPKALAACAAINPSALDRLNPNRRAQHWVNITRGHMLSGQSTQAEKAILEADRTGTAAVRCSPATRTLINDILHGPGRVTTPSPALVQLAAAVGIEHA